MASRAEPIVAGRHGGGPVADDELPRRAGAGAGARGSLRAALGDAYFHSWRLAAANVAWSLAAFAVVVAMVATPAALLLTPLLAVPTAAMFRIATRIVRGRSVSFWDGYRGIRDGLPAILGLGAALALGALVLTTNVVVGIASASPAGWAIATLAGWGLVAGWTFAWAAWPILLDPDRAGRPVRERLRLAALLCLAHPVRVGALALGMAVLLVASVITVAPALTISVALAALWAGHAVLPAADRLETALAARNTG